MSLHPGTANYNPAGNSDFTRKAEALALGIRNWSTPKATDGAKGGPGQSYGSGGTPPLPAQAAQWQTPVADDEMDRRRGKINTVAGMPHSLGGIRMAIQVVELARAGMTPDWMPGAVPRCVPVETKQNQYGERAATIVVGTERVKTRGKWRTVELLACPVTWRPHPEQIAYARRGYEDWWQALGWVRDGLIAGAMLREVEVTAAMPKVRPWLASSRK